MARRTSGRIRPSSGGCSIDCAAFAGRKIIVALSGGIACYKVGSVVSRLAQNGAGVRVLMTEAATRFIGPLTFQSLSGNAVLTSIWQADDRPDAQHVSLARWCELFILAPASADIIAKMAAGICDDVVSLTFCALPRPAARVLLAPAMNSDMWLNPITQRNIATLTQIPGCHTVGPDTGWQACRHSGPGRMSEPETILAEASRILGR